MGCEIAKGFWQTLGVGCAEAASACGTGAPAPPTLTTSDWTPAGVPPSTIPGPAPKPPTDPDDACGSPGAPFPGGDGTFDMTPACVMHDRCYRRCDVPKESCDQEFANNMQRICENSGMQIPELGITIPNGLCSIYSAAAELFVRTIGRGNYDAGQARGCAP